MEYKDSLRIGLLSFIIAINHIFYILAKFFIDILNMTLFSIFIGLIFTIFTIWFCNTYFHGMKNSFTNLKREKKENTKFIIWTMVTIYSAILTYYSIIPGVIFLILNLTYLKWIKN